MGESCSEKTQTMRAMTLWWMRWWPYEGRDGGYGGGLGATAKLLLAGDVLGDVEIKNVRLLTKALVLS